MSNRSDRNITLTNNPLRFLNNKQICYIFKAVIRVQASFSGTTNAYVHPVIITILSLTTRKGFKFEKSEMASKDTVRR